MVSWNIAGLPSSLILCHKVLRISLTSETILWNICQTLKGEKTSGHWTILYIPQPVNPLNSQSLFFFHLCFGRPLAFLETHDVCAESWKWPYILVILTSLQLLSAPAFSLWSWSFDLTIHFLPRISSTELVLLFLPAKASTTSPLDKIWRGEEGLPKPFHSCHHAISLSFSGIFFS